MTKKEERHHEWLNRIASQLSGLTMTKWCTENGVSLEKFKYWKRKLKKDSPTSSPSQTPRFVPLTVEDRPSPSTSVASLVVRIGQASVELQADFDALLLRKIVNALEASC